MTQEEGFPFPHMGNFDMDVKVHEPYNIHNLIRDSVDQALHCMDSVLSVETLSWPIVDLEES